MAGFKFDTPVGELCFTGILHNREVLLSSASGCLISLIEWVSLPDQIILRDKLSGPEYQMINNYSDRIFGVIL